MDHGVPKSINISLIKAMLYSIVIYSWHKRFALQDNLMSCFKRSTSRDFRIDGTTVSAILHGQEVRTIHHTCYNVLHVQDNEENSSSKGTPKPKKMKLSFASNSTDE